VNRITAINIVLLILLFAVTGCAGEDVIAGSQLGRENNAANISEERKAESATPPSDTTWLAVPAVFVNDTYFRIYADGQYHDIPDLDDTWVYLGSIQSAAPGWESPTQNYQTNNETMIGAEIYYSSDGRIPVTNSTWGDPLDEEIIGDSVIVIFGEFQLWYITEEAHLVVIEVMDTVVRHSLMVDGVIYSLMATAGGGDFSLNENYIFLGEVESAVPMGEFPTENLQANRDTVVGAKVYRLPAGEGNDIVVFFSDNNRFYYKQLP